MPSPGGPVRISLPVAVAVVFVGLASLLGTHALRAAQQQAPQAQPPAQKAAPDAALRELYRERVKAARDVVKVIEQRVEAGEALTPTMIDLQAQSFLRLAEAEMAAADDNAGRVTAAGQYVRRCEHILKVVDSRFQAGLDASMVQVNQAKYHVADAKVRLAETMARP